MTTRSERRGLAIEVQLRREGTSLEVVTRLAQRRLLWLLLLAGLVALAANVLLTWRTEPVRLRCAWAEDACTMTLGARRLARVPLSTVLRFEVRRDGRAAELVAVSREESVPLLRARRVADLAAQASALNRLLQDPRRGAAIELEDPRARAVRRLMVWAVAAVLALCALLPMTLAGVRTTFDRARGEARRRAPFQGSRLPLHAVGAVEVRSWADERRLRRGAASPPLRDAGRGDRFRRVVLVRTDGGAWPVTARVNVDVTAADLDAVAAEIAAFLGVPLGNRGTGPGAQRESAGASPRRW